MAMMMAQSSHDPVLEALGLSQDCNQDMSQMAYQAPSYDCSVDPAQYAWYQAQAMATVAWQLQQAASWQAQIAATYTAQNIVDTSAAATLGQVPTLYQGEGTNAPALTPRSATTSPLEKTPDKNTPGSERSTEVGSPSADGSDVGSQGGCNSEEGSPNSHGPDSDAAASLALQAWLAKEVAGAETNLPLPPPPPPCLPPKKLDLHAIIFEQPKDPISKHLLELIKGSESDNNGKAQGQKLLNLLNQGEANDETIEPRRGPVASGAHRRAAFAARAAAAKASQEEEPEAENESATRHRRRPRGARGGRGGRNN